MSLTPASPDALKTSGVPFALSISSFQSPFCLPHSIPPRHHQGMPGNTDPLPGVVTYAFNPSTLEAKEKQSLNSKPIYQIQTIRLYLFLRMLFSVGGVCVCMTQHLSWSTYRPEGTFRASSVLLGLGVIQWASSYSFFTNPLEQQLRQLWVLGMEPRPLQKHPMLLTEPSLQSSPVF